MNTIAIVILIPLAILGIFKLADIVIDIISIIYSPAINNKKPPYKHIYNPKCTSCNTILDDHCECHNGDKYGN